jgi:bifunctional non-homologous end joining protein LigD
MKSLAIPRFSPATLVRAPDPFDHPDFLFELKQDGFRALAYIEGEHCELVSRRGNVYKTFPRLCAALAQLGRYAVLDGELVCLDATGKPQFYELLRRRGEPVFCAFDVLGLDGEDLRARPTIERKLILEDLVRYRPSILYAGHVESRGLDLFRLVCELDLGIVAKHRLAPYGSEQMPWIKVLNPAYSQREGRMALFEKASRRRAVTNEPDCAMTLDPGS